jgi:diguanylate cyclase (GGDEF)-like protein
LARSTNFGFDHERGKQGPGNRLFGPVSSSAETRLAPFWKGLLEFAALCVASILLVSLGAPPLSAERAPDGASDRSLRLTTASQVHELPAKLASRARVHFVGVVTYYDPGEHNLFVQDTSGGVYVDLDKAYPLQYGDYVSVRGRALASYRTEVATDPAINVLSRNRRVTAVPVTYRELATGQMDCRLVKVTGKVRAVNVEQHENSPILHLDVSMHGGEIEVYQPFSAIELDKREAFARLEELPLLDSTVEIEGVAGGAFDTKSQLMGLIVYAQQRSAIRILKRSMVNALELPLSNIDTVFESRHIEDTSTRLRLRGTLTYYKRGEAAVLEQDGKSVFVQTREDEAIPLGEVVDAVGFVGDQEYGPSLREALLFDTRTRKEIKARAVGYAEALSGIDSDNLVSLEGLLVSQLRNSRVETFVIDVNGNFVTGRLEHALPLQHIRIGSRLRMTGICRVVPGGSWQAPSFFHIEMRTPGDVVVLSSASWWTVRHLVELLGSLGALALVISAWAVLLRRRVRQQTESIELSMTIARTRSALLETISVHKTAQSWLKEFCEKVRILLPGTDCSFMFGGERPGQSLPPASLTGQRLLHTAPLRDTEGQQVGHIQVFHTSPHFFGTKQQEVCLMLAEVANLAMQQSLLHQGLIHHSTHDPLTDLPNRRLCEQRLQDALREAAETNGRVTVVYIDVDRFKDINDRYGHKTGDSYLKHISSRLRSAIRSIDTLARVGGDEFLVIVPQKSSDTDFISLQERLHGCFQQPFEVEGHRFRGSASLGLASFPEHGATAEELKRHADHAMYIAKRKTSSGHSPRTLPQFAILTPKELERAFERKQLTLSYQPQFSADGTLQGLEALLRLQDPILGTVTPDAFISAAESCEIILHLGRWVLESAVQSAVGWGLHRGTAVLLSVNVAPAQIADPEFAEMVLFVLERNGFPANRLELELTERSFGTDSDEALRQVQRLRAAGIRIAIDDFGTGYSALSLLHRLPVDTIKIDRSFVMAMENEPNVLSIIEAISFMARSLGKRIVAEGVEKPSSMSALLQMGPMDYQGYLLSRPIDSSKVKDALQEWRSGISMPMALDEKDS